MKNLVKMALSPESAKLKIISCYKVRMNTKYFRVFCLKFLAPIWCKKKSTKKEAKNIDLMRYNSIFRRYEFCGFRLYKKQTQQLINAAPDMFDEMG